MPSIVRSGGSGKNWLWSILPAPRAWPAPLVPGSDVIQLVTWDGEYLGHVRRDGQCPPGECWVAVPKRHARPCGRYGRYGSAQAATAALAQACGKTTRNTG